MSGESIGGRTQSLRFGNIFKKTKLEAFTVHSLLSLITRLCFYFFFSRDLHLVQVRWFWFYTTYKHQKKKKKKVLRIPSTSMPQSVNLFEESFDEEINWISPLEGTVISFLRERRKVWVLGIIRARKIVQKVAVSDPTPINLQPSIHFFLPTSSDSPFAELSVSCHPLTWVKDP